VRDNETIRRRNFKSKEKKASLRKIISILQKMPDAILITNKEKPLFLNYKAKQMLRVHSISDNEMIE
jgi:signal transduction histidine kinase